MRSRLAAVLVPILAASAFAQDPVGPGTADNNGLTPVLSCNQAWMGNTAFAWSISNAAGGGTAFLALSLQPATFAFQGTNVNVSWLPQDFLALEALPLTGGFGAPGAGSATFALPLNFPVNIAAAGINVWSQAYVPDPLFPPNPLASSKGLRSELTMPPQVFVGCSVGGVNDPYAFVNPLTGTIQSQGTGPNNGDNVTFGVYAHGGLDLFVSKSFAPYVGRADLRGAAPVWSTFFTPAPAAACYGIFHDWKRDRIYTLTGPTGATRELVAIDSNPASPTFGQQLATTTGLAGGIGLERWCLSRSGDRAAIPAIFTTTATGVGFLRIVDTDPASATYMQVIVSSQIPVNVPNLATVAAAAGFTPDDETAIIPMFGLGVQEIARYHLPSGTWLDNNLGTPQVDNVVLPGLPNRMDVAHSGRFAFVTSSSSPGHALRVDFGATFPYPATVTSLQAGSGLLASAYGAGISRDDSMLSVTSLTPPKLLILDSATGAVLQNVPLTGFGNIYTTCWR